MAMTQIDDKTEVSLEYDKPFTDDLMHRTPDQYATDVVRRWLMHLERGDAREHLVTMFVLNNPERPEDEIKHRAIAAVLGVSVPMPSEASIPFQEQEVVYEDSRGKIRRQTMYLGEEAESTYVPAHDRTDSRIINGLPHGAFLVHYSVERRPNLNG
jgi:hypothetical protein